MSEKKIVITGKSKNIKFDDFDSQIQIDELKYDAMDIEDALYEYGDIEQSVRSSASQAENSGS